MWWNKFASFFSEKINDIRKEIGTSSSYAEVTQIRPQFQKEVTMSVFEEIDSNISPSWELRTASPRGRYGERHQHDSCLKCTYKNTTCWPATAYDVTTGMTTV